MFLLLTKQWIHHGRKNRLRRHLSHPRIVLVSLISGSERCLWFLSKPDTSLLSTTRASDRSLYQTVPALVALVIAIMALLQSTKDAATKRVSHILQKVIWLVLQASCEELSSG